ncbi:hypothetical protein TKK_0001272 [Trichogramma kaykai]|uniref:Large ribosomal subunit protein bL36m n=1 Tax=Trichogramma kaykai TaxID=54128 RepID=A0ABD2WX38_9HYME
MNLQILTRFQGTVNNLVKRAFTPMINCRGIHGICKSIFTPQPIVNNWSVSTETQFLTPIIPQFNQVCGMKQRGKPQLRCKGCFYVAKEGRLFVYCRLKPRHKQMSMQKSFKYRRILTFAYQKKERDW